MSEGQVVQIWELLLSDMDMINNDMNPEVMTIELNYGLMDYCYEFSNYRDAMIKSVMGKRGGEFNKNI